MRYGFILRPLKQSLENTSAWSLLGNASVAHKRSAKAIQCLGHVLATAPDSAESVYHLGAIQRLHDESKRANECFCDTLALKPRQAQAQWCGLSVERIVTLECDTLVHGSAALPA